MNLRILANALFVGMVCTLASCLDSDTEITTYDDISISSVKFGTLTRTFHTTSKSGEDSTYVGTYTASSYLIYIDQRNRSIYNVDSLPLGTDLTKILLTVNTKNSAVALLKEGEGDTAKYLSMGTSDTLDLSYPRKMIVFSNDGQKKCEYDISIAAHKESADSFKWSMLGTSSELAQLDRVRAVNAGGKVYVLGKEGNEAKVFSTEISDGKTWNAVALPASLSAKSHIASVSNTLYIVDKTASALYTSADGSVWQTTSSADLANISAIVGEQAGVLYGVAEPGVMLASTDNGAIWSRDNVTVDNENRLFPTEDVNAVVMPLPTNKECSRLTVIGNYSTLVNEDISQAIVWSRLYDPNVEAQEPWVYQPFASGGSYALPNLGNLSVTSYDEKMLAIGYDYNADTQAEGYSKVYFSKDWGLTWKTAVNVPLPTGFSVAKAEGASSATMVSDSNKMLWIICGGTGQVWRGRLNGYTWADNQIYFE